MTPDDLLERGVRDRGRGAVRVWEGELAWEAAAEGVRITRGPAGGALVAVVGLGYAGLPSALALRRAGFRIVAIDTSSARLNDIRTGQAAMLPDAAEAREHLRDEGFELSASVEEIERAEAVLICVPAIVDAERRPSLEALKGACAAVVAHARAGQTLVLTSTCYVGATRELLVEPLAQRGLRVGEDVFVAFSPERIDPGVPEHERERTPRVLGAVTDTCFACASRLLRPTCERLHRVSSPEAAEMAKLYESTFRAVNVALAFEMADACRARALDAIEVTDAAASKPFGFMAHHPSAGVGGHAVGMDPYYLLEAQRERGGAARLVEEAMRTIAARPGVVAMRAHELLRRSGQQLRDVRVLVVGAAYKPGVADSSCAPAVEIISWLCGEGVHVDYHDPLVPSLRIDGEDMYSVDPDPRRDASGFGPEDYDLAILVTMQPGFDYGWLRRCPEVLDCTYRADTGRRRIVP
jgi:UDP-N-acetyl-D-glucosamine dehydrogenase